MISSLFVLLMSVCSLLFVMPKRQAPRPVPVVGSGSREGIFSPAGSLRRGSRGSRITLENRPFMTTVYANRTAGVAVLAGIHLYP